MTSLKTTAVCQVIAGKANIGQRTYCLLFKYGEETIVLNRLCFLEDVCNNWTIIDLAKGTVESQTRGMYRSVQMVVHQENTYRVVFTCVPHIETDVVNDNTYITCQLMDKAWLDAKAVEQEAVEQEALEQKAILLHPAYESWLFAGMTVLCSGICALAYCLNTSK